MNTCNKIIIVYNFGFGLKGSYPIHVKMTFAKYHPNYLSKNIIQNIDPHHSIFIHLILNFKMFIKNQTFHPFFFIWLLDFSSHFGCILNFSS